MEKVCQLPQNVLHKIIQYILWLIECSHVSGKQWAINFFGLASSFPTLINIIDELDGIRKIYNQISTLSTLENNPNLILSDDEEYAQRQSMR